MDLMGSIALTGMAMSGARTVSSVNLALLGKVLDTAQIEGEALEQMMDMAAPNTRLLDVYA